MNCRTDSTLPMWTASNMDTELPRLVNPYIEIVLPSRAKLRRDMLEDSVAMSNNDKVEPNPNFRNTDIPDPSRQ